MIDIVSIIIISIQLIRFAQQLLLHNPVRILRRVHFNILNGFILLFMAMKILCWLRFRLIFLVLKHVFLNYFGIINCFSFLVLFLFFFANESANEVIIIMAGLERSSDKLNTILFWFELPIDFFLGDSG